MNNAIDPGHYKGFSNGAQVIDISENLTSNAGQAVQYIARSCRLDGHNKGEQIEDLTKAVWFINRELERLSGIEASAEPELWQTWQDVPEGVPFRSRRHKGGLKSWTRRGDDAYSNYGTRVETGSLNCVAPFVKADS